MHCTSSSRESYVLQKDFRQQCMAERHVIMVESMAHDLSGVTVRYRYVDRFVLSSGYNTTGPLVLCRYRSSNLAVYPAKTSFASPLADCATHRNERALYDLCGLHAPASKLAETMVAHTKH